MRKVSCGNPFGLDLRADSLAQRVDGLECAVRALEVPEFPPVAGRGSLDLCAEAVNGACPVVANEGSVGAQARGMALLR